jgi:hypothetical protein
MNPGTYPFFVDERFKRLYEEAEIGRQAKLIRLASAPSLDDPDRSTWDASTRLGSVRRLVARLTAA